MARNMGWTITFALALILALPSLAYAGQDAGEAGRAADTGREGDHAQDTVSEREVEPAPDHEAARLGDEIPVADRALDHPVDRPSDRRADPPADKVTDRATDRVTETDRASDRDRDPVTDRRHDRPCVDHRHDGSDHNEDRCDHDHPTDPLQIRNLIHRLIQAHEWGKLVRLLLALGII